MPSYKVIKSGHIIEIYAYDRSAGGSYGDEIALWNENEEILSREGGRLAEGEQGNVERQAEYQSTVNQRARNKIRRLINANFDENSLFVTLTFAENVQDVAWANKQFQNFIKKMKRRQADFGYVAVIEFQKRGAVHYHMLCNLKLEWDSPEQLKSHERHFGEEVWGHGFVDIGYKQTDNAGAYLIKYMTKDNNDIRLKGKKRYFFPKTFNSRKK